MLHGQRQLYSLHNHRRHFYSEIAKDFDTRFETSNYQLDRPLCRGKNKKVIGLMKDELGRKIIK